MKNQYTFLIAACKCTLASIIVGFTVSILLMCVVMILSTAAGASETGGPAAEDSPAYSSPSEAQRGTLMFYGEGGLTGAPVLNMDVKMKISGMISRIHVLQKFKNPDKQWKEGIYVFPLPQNAAVDHMRL